MKEPRVSKNKFFYKTRTLKRDNLAHTHAEAEMAYQLLHRHKQEVVKMLIVPAQLLIKQIPTALSALYQHKPLPNHTVKINVMKVMVSLALDFN